MIVSSTQAESDRQPLERQGATPRPNPRPRNLPSSLRAAFLASLLAALAVAPAAAQTTITLVSNTGQADESVGNLSTYDHAQAFTTGAHAAGYKLTGVDLDFAAVESGSSYAVSIWTNGRFGWPGTSIGTLTSPTALAANALNSYTTSGIDLAANTTYHVVVDSSSANTSNLQNTGSSSEDSGGQSGWSIANGSLFRDRLATIGQWQPFDDSRKLAIKGYAKPPAPSKPVLTLRKWPHPYTPEVVVAGNPPRVVVLGHYELSWPKLNAGGLLLHHQFAAGKPEHVKILLDTFSNINDEGEIYTYVRVIGPRDGVRTIQMRGKNYLANDCEGTGPCEGAGEWSDPPLVVMPDPPGLPSMQVEAPTITGAPALSASGSDGTWTAGATVEATLTFSEAVTVDTTGGTPSIGLDLGGTESRSAPYLRGSGTTALVFAYTLTATDGSHTSLLVPIDSLALNGGTIRSQATSADAALGHSGAAKAGSTGGLGNRGDSGTQDEGDPFTARFGALPQNHNGSDAFTFELHFSEEPDGLSYTTVAGGLLEVTGATVDKARRLTAGSNLAWEVTMTPSQSGEITITLPARACSEANAVCAGTRSLASAATATVRGVPFTASFSGVPAEHDGSTAFDIRFHLSEEPASLSYRTVQNGLFAVTGGSIEKASRLVAGKNNGWTVRILPSGHGDVTVRVNGTSACDNAPGVCTSDGRKLAGGLSVSIAGPAVLSVADAEVEEGADATLAFTVTLSKSRFTPTTVDYATSDGTATAGSDYTSTSGRLTFAPLETSKTVSVPVQDDAHDEGSETLTLTLSNASGARLGDSTATGTINNTDPMPLAWLARFGRAAADHTIEAIEGRFSAAASQPRGSHLTIGGRRVDTLFERFRSGDREGRAPLGADAAAAHVDPGSLGARMDRLNAGLFGGSLSGVSPMDVSPANGGIAGGGQPAGGSGWTGFAAAVGLPDLGNALMGSSFYYSRAAAEEAESAGWLGDWTAWGDTAATQFAAADGPVSLDGEVATATLGVDSRWGRWTAGVALSHSEGQGAYRHPGATGGALTSTLASLNPYARFELNERASLWGIVGFGVGGLTLTPAGGEDALGTVPAIRTDIASSMAAFGGRGVFSVRSSGLGSYELAVRSDVRVTQTGSDTVSGLMGAEAVTSRVRLMLEGTGTVLLPNGGSLRPSLEAGLRYDGGDAETGAGLEIGAGLGYASGHFAVEVNARGLMAHQDTEYEEWGLSGSVKYTPRTDGRGLSMNVGSSWGQAQSGVQGLWSQADAGGFARGGAFSAAQRFETEIGYGFAGRRKADTLWVPYVRAQAGESAGQALTMGLKLTSGPNVDVGLEFGQRNTATDGPGRAIQLRVSLQW